MSLQPEGMGPGGGGGAGASPVKPSGTQASESGAPSVPMAGGISLVMLGRVLHVLPRFVVMLYHPEK